ncbi:MAG: tetratricopeptide repeat protein [Myxococcota bacterium]
MWIWWIALSWADKPLPDLGPELARVEWARLDLQLTQGCQLAPLLGVVTCQDGVVDKVVARIDAFSRAVVRDAGLEYLAGLAYRYDGRRGRARRRYEAAVALDPTYDAAWYDLGELHLVGGRLDEAEAAFAKVAELVADGEKAWVGPWRLAEVAASRGDAEAFETHIKAALQDGFTFRSIAGLPNWKAFYADPRLRDTFDKLLTVYATPEVRNSLR